MYVDIQINRRVRPKQGEGGRVLPINLFGRL